MASFASVRHHGARISAFFSLKKKYPPKNIFFLDIPSSNANIWGQTNFQSQEFPRSGWKAEGIEEKRKEKSERAGPHPIGQKGQLVKRNLDTKS